jgi:Transposase DDE domain/Domain of unknown function (DUF4372)
MHAGQTVFAQLMDHLSLPSFRTCVSRYRGDYRTRSLSCLDQFLCLAFAQLTYRESLRDIETCLRVSAPKLYHMGFRGRVCRSTLADANEKRDWRIFHDFASTLIATAGKLYAGQNWGRNLQRSVYALDSTTIDLCLQLFPWATFKQGKAGVKLHTLLNVVTHIPSFIHITKANVHDVRALDELPVESGAVYLLDRAYVDYARLHRLVRAGAHFVTRPRKSARFRRKCSMPVSDADRSAGVTSDQHVRLSSFYSRKGYPDILRRVRFVDPETRKKFKFITNNLDWTPLTIALLYKSRWQVELFFRWIKQHLRIKAFYGTSENAVKTQVWTAVSIYVLVAIIKKRLNLPHSLYSILQVLSVSLFEKVPLSELFAASTVLPDDDDPCNSLNLFEF